jgi:hypothetical protein
VSLSIRNPKDFWTGLIYIATGAAAVWLGAGYKIGTAGRIGPGYFPRALAGILVLLGVVSLVRAFLTKGAPLTAVAWKPLLLIPAACVLFALLLSKIGLIGALLALGLVSAAASKEFTLNWKVAVGFAALIAFCVLVFVKGLGVPMPIVGSWFEPLLGPWLR